MAGGNPAPILPWGGVRCWAVLELSGLRDHREMQLLVLRNPTEGDRSDKCLEGGEGCGAHASLNTQNHLSPTAFSAVEIF